MSGRIYDSGINPKCNKCGSKMWTSSDTNFNGCQCKRTGCNGKPIYEYEKSKTNDSNIKIENDKYILEGVFTTFNRTKSKYTNFERIKNSIFTMKENNKTNSK